MARRGKERRISPDSRPDHSSVKDHTSGNGSTRPGNHHQNLHNVGSAGLKHTLISENRCNGGPIRNPTRLSASPKPLFSSLGLLSRPPSSFLPSHFIYCSLKIGLMILTRRADSAGLRKHHALLDDVRKLLTKVIRQAIGNSEGILVFFRTN